MNEEHKRRLVGPWENGELVTVLTQGGKATGLVVDYWPSNMYERAHYEILLDGEIVHFDTKYVFGIDSIAC